MMFSVTTRIGKAINATVAPTARKRVEKLRTKDI